MTLPPLSVGSHISPEAGLCLLEMTAHLAGEPHSDSPECTCPVLAAFGRVLNDRFVPLGFAARLSPLAAELIGTRGDPRLELARAELLAWRACTVFAPLALEAVGMAEHAATLRVAPTLAAAARAARAAARAATAVGAVARAARAARAVNADSAAASAGYAAASAARATCVAVATYAAAHAAGAARAATVVDDPSLVFDAAVATLRDAINITPIAGK
jgi:hypothetical protein